MNKWVFVLLVGFWWLSWPSQVQATACTATITPLGLPPNTQGIVVSITLQNTGTEPIFWMEIQRPFRERMTFTPRSMNDWQMVDYDDYIEFNDGQILPGESVVIVGDVNTGNTDGGDNSWGVTAQDAGDGGQAPCEGDFGAYSNSSIDLSGPSISNTGITLLSTTSVRVDWTTNENATSRVDYGSSTGSYDGNVIDEVMATNHSLTITGLTAGSTYFIRPRSVDASGNTGSGGEYSFTMPAPNQTITTETTITITETIKAAETTKIVLVRDTTPPGVVITTELDGVYDEAPTIVGRVQDSEGVMRVQYSTDEGRNWLSVDEFLGEGKASSSFSFTPVGLLDGNYEIRVRAFDPANNAGMSKIQTLVIDRLPPRVGTALIAVSSQPLVPTKEGLLYGLSKVHHTFIASAIGGATEIKIVATLQDGSQNTFDFPLSFNSETSLWYGSLYFTNPGTYQLVAHALDGAGNSTERSLQTMILFPSGKVRDQESGEGISNASVTVYVKDSTTGQYVVWEGASYGQENPQAAQLDGSYSLLLPSGTYYIEVAAQGFLAGRTAIFQIDSTKPLFSDIALEKRKEVILFGRKFVIPTFHKDVLTMQLLSLEQKTASTIDLLVGKELPFFILQTSPKPFYSSDFLGRPTIVSFLNTWSPLAVEQLSLFNAAPYASVRNSVIFTQETQSSVELFMKRGGYKLDFHVDEDGLLVEKFNLHSVPTHFYLDSKGVVRDVKIGYLSVVDLLGLL